MRLLGFVLFSTMALTACSATAASSAQPLRIACVGDSTTMGTGLKYPEANSYPAQLQTMLGRKYDVRNYGVGSRAMLRNVNLSYWDTPAFTEALAFEPDVVIINLGINDTAPRFWTAENKPRYEVDYEAMVERFLALPSKPRVFICYPTPLFPPCKELQITQMRDEINPAVGRVAKATGVRVIDLYAALSGHAECFPDGCHPNADGARRMAETIKKSLSSNRR